MEKEVGYAYYKQTCQKRWKKPLESLSIDPSLEMWYIKEYQPDGLHSRNPAYPVMGFSEFEHVYLIGRVIGILSKSDVVQPTDVEKYLELHPEFE